MRACTDPGTGWRRRGQQPVEARHRTNGRTGPGELEHRQPAEAITDRRDPLGRKVRRGRQCVKACGDTSAYERWIGPETRHRGDNLVITKNAAVTMQIGGGRDIAKIGQHRAPPAHIAADPIGLMSNQDGAAICGPGRAVKFAPQGDLSILVVESLAHMNSSRHARLLQDRRMAALLISRRTSEAGQRTGLVSMRPIVFASVSACRSRRQRGIGGRRRIEAGKCCPRHCGGMLPTIADPFTEGLAQHLVGDAIQFLWLRCPALDDARQQGARKYALHRRSPYMPAAQRRAVGHFCIILDLDLRGPGIGWRVVLWSPEQRRSCRRARTKAELHSFGMARLSGSVMETTA